MHTNKNITRAEFCALAAASMLHRLYALRADAKDTLEDITPHLFADGADISAWARSDIYWACRRGIMTGTGNHCFAPTAYYTREQSIATMLRLFDRAYAASKLTESTSPFQIIYGSTGPGVSHVSIEAADGTLLFTDFRDSHGDFYAVQQYGEWLSLQWNRGRAIVWDSEKHLRVIDTQGNTVTAFTANIMNGNETSGIEAGLGNRLLITESSGTQTMYVNGIARHITTPYSAARFNQYSDTYIGGNNGVYTLYDLSGDALTEAYPNAFDEAGQDIYSVWLSDTRYSYFRCDAAGNRRDLFTVAVTQRPGALPTDGAGVYALQTGAQEITCFDRFGDTLGTIKTPFSLYYADIVFTNGQVQVSQWIEQRFVTVRYLPTGEQTA